LGRAKGGQYLKAKPNPFWILNLGYWIKHHARFSSWLRHELSVVGRPIPNPKFKTQNELDVVLDIIWGNE
jgi:hypothetical protein